VPKSFLGRADFFRLRVQEIRGNQFERRDFARRIREQKESALSECASTDVPKLLERFFAVTAQKS
jgi:hypothetical protein